MEQVDVLWMVILDAFGATDLLRRNAVHHMITDVHPTALLSLQHSSTALPAAAPSLPNDVYRLPSVGRCQ
jgi:hypothetical protein